MARLQPQQWGNRQRIDIKDDWALLTEDERRRKAEEPTAPRRERGSKSPILPNGLLDGSDRGARTRSTIIG